MPHSIYVHIPFCGHRCAYCDFNTYANQEELIPAYVEALCREVRYVSACLPGRISVHTVYFGGGTPSLLSPPQLEQLLTAICSGFHLQRDAEVSLEANPGTISIEKLSAYRDAGINRISLGVQSANGEELRMLERTHTFAEVLAAVAAIRRARYDNLNLDLIYGLPGQQMAVWKMTVRRILELQPEHISAYALTIEHGTPFGHWARRGLIASPDPDLAADMYEWVAAELDRTGYRNYEISNWAQEGRECQHNLQYWRAEPYLGFGAGAHGYSAGQRYSNVLSIRDYIDRVAGGKDASGEAAGDEHGLWKSPAMLSRHQQTIQDEMSDFMIMGLRLTRDGVDSREFERRFGRSLEHVYGPQIRQLAKQELLEAPPDGALPGNPGSKARPVVPLTRVRLSQRGRLLGNRVFAEFVGVTPTR